MYKRWPSALVNTPIIITTSNVKRFMNVLDNEIYIMKHSTLFIHVFCVMIRNQSVIETSRHVKPMCDDL